MKKLIFTILIIHCSLIIANAQWIQCSDIWAGNTVTSIASGNSLFAGTNNFGVYVSNNNGQNWTQTALNSQSVSSIAVSGNTVVAGCHSAVYISMNNGVNWTAAANIPYQNVYSVAINGNTIFAGTSDYTGYCLYRSTNNGASWIQSGSFWSCTIWSLCSYNNFVYAGLWHGGSVSGIHMTLNNGLSWLQILSVYSGDVFSIAQNGDNIIAGADPGVYLSTNAGVNWSTPYLNNQNVYSVSVEGNDVIAGTDTNGVYHATIYGANWVKRNQGFPAGIGRINALCIANGYLFAGTTGHGLWKRPLNEVIGIKSISSNLPDEYKLFQNYPNPFNPETRIHYEISKNGFVELVVYDALGREIETLVNEKQSPGIFEATFNASQYSSGIYFYKLEIEDPTGRTENFRDVKKMLLVK